MYFGINKTMLGLALALASTVAIASVTFNASNGTGFVGKGDVQQAFNWNNAQLQSNAVGVSFTYGHQETYSAVCTWTTGAGTTGARTHDITYKTSVSVEGDIAYDARKNKNGQITGFNLTGFGGEFTESGTVPVFGAPCKGDDRHYGVWTEVITNDNLTGGLYVNYGEASVLLY